MQKLILTIISLFILNLGLSQSSYFQDNFSHLNYSNFHDLPLISYPYLKYSRYKNLQSKYLIKNTAYFQLNENVKSVKETVIIKNLYGSEHEAKIEFNYEFLENNNLSKYQEYLTQGSDSTKTLRNEEYVYDDYGKMLKNISYTRNFYGMLYKVKVLFDTLGFADTETYEVLSAPNDKEAVERKEFDYTLNYEWNQNRDSLYLNFIYKTEKRNYQRYENRFYSYVKMKNDTLFEKDMRLNLMQLDKDQVLQLYTSITYIDTTINKNLNLFSLVSESRLIDDRGNIVQLTFHDNEIKGSFNFHTQYKYKYNEKNEIIEIAHYTSNWSHEYEFVLTFKIKINYLKHDEQGNWISKKVTNYTYRFKQDIENKLHIDSTVFIYNREIEYH